MHHHPAAGIDVPNAPTAQETFCAWNNSSINPESNATVSVNEKTKSVVLCQNSHALDSKNNREDITVSGEKQQPFTRFNVSTKTALIHFRVSILYLL